MATFRTTRTRRQSAVHHLLPDTRGAALALHCELALIALHPPLAAAHIAISIAAQDLLPWSRHR